jgi:integrase
MPKHTKRLTDTEARKIPPPPLKGGKPTYSLHWCPSTPGFGVRITSADARAWIIERRVDGKTTRRTVGAASGAGAIHADAARILQLNISSELQQGVDRLETKRERIAAEKVVGVTFGEALREYVKTKRRAKDGLALKDRTKADYLSMIASGRMVAGRADSKVRELHLNTDKPARRKTQDGELYPLESTPLQRIDANDIRTLYKDLAPRGGRRQTYAMQVLRAVLRHHGVNVADNPLSPTTAGKQRVTLAPSRGDPRPIPPEALGAWWRAASAIKSPSADMLRFALLVGGRPGEVSALEVGHLDSAGGRITMHDTKNRTDHEVLLSRQAAEIATRAAKGKKKGAKLFGIADAGKTLDKINKAAGVENVSQHKLRHTFASVAADLVSVFALKRMLNHAAADDVTAVHYVHTGEKSLRNAWQTVADAIECAP